MMRRTVVGGLIALALPLAAPIHAKAQAATTCHQLGWTTSCETTADPSAQLQQQQRDLDAMLARNAEAGARSSAASAAQTFSWQDVPPTRCSAYQKAFPDNHAFCAARDVAANRKAVGDLIAAGRCDDALKGALGTGDLAFAREVRDFCGKK